MDTSFGTRGKVTTDFTSNADSAFGLGIQTNGKIVIAGESGGGGANPRFALARYNTNGSLQSPLVEGLKEIGRVRRFPADLSSPGSELDRLPAQH